MTPLRIIFMGTPDFAVPALRVLHDSGHDIAAVYCQPPKPANRGQKLRKTPMHLVGEELGIPVFTPKTLRDEDSQKTLSALSPDIIVVAAYGLILPQEILDTPRLGCLNIHGSLLPRWRGAAPIHRALLAGESETGITIMQMDAGLDTGDMLLKESIPITDKDTSESLHDALCAIGAKLIIKAVDLAAKNKLTPKKQPEEGVTYAEKLTRHEGEINWHHSAADIERKIRAMTPWPGSFFKHDKETIKVLEAEIISCATQPSGQPAGTLLGNDFTVACASNALRLCRVQRAGKKPTDGASLLRGLRLNKGHIFCKDGK